MLVAACGISVRVTVASPHQDSVIPAVADSPTAQSLMEQARAQSVANPAEAAHLARRLLDEFGDRIVQVGPAEDGHFNSVAEEVESMLLSAPDVLAKFLRSESDAAERLLVERGPASIASRRRWTPAGLTASLLLAQSAMRSGQFDAVVALLERVQRHPMLTGAAQADPKAVDRCAEYFALLAMAQRARGDEAGATAAIRSLERFAEEFPADTTVIVARDAAVHFVAPPRVALALSSVTGGAHGTLPDASWRRIFSEALGDSLFHRYYGAEALARLPEDAALRARADASWLTAEPTVSNDTVYVSEGRALRAFDATTAQERWSIDLAIAGIGRETGVAVDLSSVAVSGFDAAVIAGNGFSNARTDGGRVFLVDVRDGTQKWSLSVDGLEGRPELAGAFAIGSPILVGDLVLVTVRRPSTRLEQADSVLALGRSDGRIRWLTLVAAAGGTRAVSVRRSPGMTLDAGALYVATPLGAVARVRLRDGALEWLRRFRVPLREPRFSGEAWEFARPAVLAGRVFSVAPDESEVVALDASTGATLAVAVIGPGTAWGSPRLLVVGGGSLLAVGSDVIAFDPLQLATPRWKLSESEATLWEARGGLDNRGGIRGRVSIAGNVVLVPGTQALWFVDLASGRRIASIETNEPVNAVLAEDRVVALGVDHLDVYMSGVDAVRVLRGRLDLAQDASAALALFDLAVEGDDLALALDAAERASSILKTRSGDPLRGMLADRLVEHAPKAGALGARFLAVAAEMVDDAQSRVRLAFARAEWFARRGDASLAVEAWREIASLHGDEVMLSPTGEVRATRAIAISHLAEFMSRSEHRSVAEEYEERALSALRAAPVPLSLEACIAQVREFPRSRAAADAARAGAALFDARGTSLSAAALLDAVLREAQAPPMREDIATLLHTTRGMPTPATAWPAFGEPALVVTEIPGRLVRRAFAALESGAHEVVYFMEDFDLVARSAGEFKEIWRCGVHDRDPVLLDDGAVLVLTEIGKGRSESYFAVDAVTGLELWRTSDFNELLGPLAAADADPNGMRTLPEGAPFFPGQVLPMMAGGKLNLVRRDGCAASIALRDGSSVVASHLLAQVFMTAGDAELLALGGRLGAEQQGQSAVLLCDPVTLKPVASFATASGGDVRWIRRSSSGLIAVGTTAGVEMWTLDAAPNGLDARFQMGVADARTWDSTSPLWCENRLFALDRNGRLFSMDAWSGAVLEVGFGDGAADFARVVRTISRFGTGVVAHADSRIALIDAHGRLIGRDGTVGEPNFIAAILGEDRIVLVNGVGARQTPNATRTALVSEYVYFLNTLDPAQGLRISGPTLEVHSTNQRFSRAIGVDGWVLLSNDSRTLAVGFSKKIENQPPNEG